ncbi:peptidoglycan-binding protein [Streptomyces sp. SID11385]|nr:peptidoglycan-binding protein [Streptomyces sp. SID11385]
MLLTGAGIGASFLVKSPAQAAADAKAPPQDVLTAPVERRSVKDSVVLRGTVVAGQSADVTPAAGAAAGTTGSVVTKAPLAVGSTVRAGQVVAEISGRPVFALKGRVPVYRDLTPGAHGDDVAQLQSALRALGHGTGSDASGTFGPGTKTALTAFYAAIGYAPVPAGGQEAEDGGGTDAAEDAVTGAERAWEDAHDALAKDRNAGTERAESRAAEDLARARERLATTQAAAGPMLPAAEVVYLSAFPARVDSVSATLGGIVTGKVMTVSAGRLAVRGLLQEAQKGLVRSGQKVGVLDERSGTEYAGRVRTVSGTLDVAEGDGGGANAAGQGQDPGAAQGGEEGYPVTVETDKALPAALVGQEVRLTVEAAASKGNSLVVPVTALSTRSDGRTVVTVVSTGGRQRTVRVSPGTTGDGYVEVRPAAGTHLDEGDKVVTGVRAAKGEAK